MGVSIYCSMVMHISHALFEYMQMRTRPHVPTHPGSLPWWKAALVYSWNLKMMRFAVAKSANCRRVNNVEKTVFEMYFHSSCVKTYDLICMIWGFLNLITP